MMSNTDGRPTHEIVSNGTALSDDRAARLCTEYFEREAAHYDDFDASVDHRRRYCATVDDHVVRALTRQGNISRVLSFGCGTGRRESGIAQRLPGQPVMLGIESSPAMAAIALNRGLKVYESVEEYDSGPVDAALVLSSFVHVPSAAARRAVLQGIAANLVDEGILVIDVFNIDDRHEWGPQLAMTGTTGNPGDVLYRRVDQDHIAYMHYFSVGEICGLVEESGFVIESLVAVGYAHLAGNVPVPLDEGCLLLTCRSRRKK